MKKIVFKGAGTALVTPFTYDNKINYEILEKIIEMQINNKADALIVCGTTGESATLSTNEKKDLIKFVVNKVNKRIPVIAGTGSNNTFQSIELTKYAESVGVDAVLVVTPYYNKTTQRGLIRHFSEIASSTSLPIILYNVPSRTGVNIEPQTCYELSKINNIVGIKEASGDISQIVYTKYLCKDNLHIYSGNDDQTIPILSIGGVGAISVLSNIYPLYVHDMCYNFFNGNITKAMQMQINSVPLIKELFCEVNPIPIKYAMKVFGFDCGLPRLPLVELSQEHQRELYQILSTNILK